MVRKCGSVLNSNKLSRSRKYHLRIGLNLNLAKITCTEQLYNRFKLLYQLLVNYFSPFREFQIDSLGDIVYGPRTEHLGNLETESVDFDQFVVTDAVRLLWKANTRATLSELEIHYQPVFC